VPRGNSERPAVVIHAAYRASVLGRLQDTRGEPRLRIRVLAALIILGIVVLTAPLVMVPVITWLMHQV
jgi:hypothetical protein